MYQKDNLKTYCFIQDDVLKMQNELTIQDNEVKIVSVNYSQIKFQRKFHLKIKFINSGFIYDIYIKLYLMKNIKYLLIRLFIYSNTTTAQLKAVTYKDHRY
jgi:hypothetical protein